ncbi:putative TIR domain-containing protein [Helianthus debilis subsp. tardiflorus]
MVVLTEHESSLPGSSSSSSTHDLNHRYDVFLSFRGVDTRNGFTDHLYNTLLGARINTFLDDEEIETGEPLKPELESAIRSSRACIIVLSENYASSRWCLDELVLILEQKRKFNQIVIPIFYHVEPTDVRKQQSTFMKAMAQHKERMNAEAQKMELWERALTQVANLKGVVANGRRQS